MQQENGEKCTTKTTSEVVDRHSALLNICSQSFCHLIHVASTENVSRFMRCVL